MEEKLKLAEELIEFIYDSPTAFQAVGTVEKVLLGCGFKELKESGKWSLSKGGKYYTKKNNSAIIAFVTGSDSVVENGFKIVGTHTDSPTFRIKPNPHMTCEGGYLKLNTEVYGGPILNTWMDRPLAIAGRVVLRSGNPMEPEEKLININKPLLVIPNLAIHMNREVNKGIELNPQKDMIPLMGIINDTMEKDNYLFNILAEELKIDKDSIIDFDLFLYEYEKGCIMGMNKEFISSSRLDDLAMVHAALKALVQCKSTKATNVLVCFDNEEVGSSTKQGADSIMLSSILERIVEKEEKGKEAYFRALSKSFMISSDLAHAVHPNSSEKADPVNRPMINKGPVIKVSARQSYTSDSFSSAIYEQICKKANVPVQRFVNRSDERGGSTIGPISSTHVNIPSVDIGTAILGMHSIRELGGVEDHFYITESFKEFYNL
ncbi:putative M18 family aminopeptidase 2 [Clostridium liquoris]|uniref:M18 family aminopeptidase n=1 Tax=Clostridium liquoris TaxID=1289519 RepID=A0A2T0B354_9CLOT|nr:M18 family aminopeptidase [Clostridium liquoris]PRR78187.1 putative M18 family aminopeptidase 2 [Clostridium liquoris]